MAYHELKTWPEYYKAIYDDRKKFEVRKDDRNFQVGDTLDLQEYDPEIKAYSGRSMRVKVIYKLPGGDFGIKKGYCVLGIEF